MRAYLPHPRGSAVTRITLVTVTLIVCGVTGLQAEAASAAPALTPSQSSLLSTGTAQARDRLLPGRPNRTLTATASATSYCPTGTVSQNGVKWKGGLFAVTANGSPTSVCIYTSTSFTYDAAVNREWATFFAQIPHGAELGHLIVYVAPMSQITAGYLCGPMADSCYDPGLGAMYLTGETPPDGANIQQIAAHEYGHHIAAWRVNTPWDALSTGPKRWATSAQVCDHTRRNEMYPGDEGAHYEDNPGEIWAESYRVYATSVIKTALDPWEILNPRWEAKSSNLTAAAGDVYRPWVKAVTKKLSGKLSSSGSQTYNTTLSFPLDGRLQASASVKGSLRVKVAVKNAAGALLTPVTSRSSTATLNVCSSPSAKVTVTRLSGTGTWTLQLQSPGA